MRFWGRKVYGVWPGSSQQGYRESVPPLSAPKIIERRKVDVKISEYKSYDDLPLFLNSAVVAKALGVAPSSAYELMHEADFPVLKVGNRIVVPKEKFVEWVEQHTKGGENG